MDEMQRRDHCNNTVSLFIGRRIVTTGIFITPNTTSKKLASSLHGTLPDTKPNAAENVDKLFNYFLGMSFHLPNSGMC